MLRSVTCQHSRADIPFALADRCFDAKNLHELDGGLVPVGRGGDAIHVLHLGGISEHVGSLSFAGEAGDLRAADAVVGGG